MSKIHDFGQKLYEAVIHKPKDMILHLFGKHVRVVHSQKGDSVRIDTPLQYIGHNIQNIFRRQTKVEYVTEPMAILLNIQDEETASANAVRKAALKELLRDTPQALLDNNGLQPRTLKVAINMLLESQKKSKDPATVTVMETVRKFSSSSTDKDILRNCVKILLGVSEEVEPTPGDPTPPYSSDPMIRNLFAPFRSEEASIHRFENMLEACSRVLEPIEKRRLIDKALRHLIVLSERKVDPADSEKFFYNAQELADWTGDGDYDEDNVYIPPDKWLSQMLTKGLGIEEDSKLYTLLFEKFSARYKDIVEPFQASLLEEVLATEYADKELTESEKKLIKKMLSQQILRTQNTFQLAKRYANESASPVLTEQENAIYQSLFNVAILLVRDF